MQVCCHHVIYMYIIRLKSLTKEERINASVSMGIEMVSLYDKIILYDDEKLLLLVCMLKVPVNNFSIVSRKVPVFLG